MLIKIDNIVINVERIEKIEYNNGELFIYLQSNDVIKLKIKSEKFNVFINLLNQYVPVIDISEYFEQMVV